MRHEFLRLSNDVRVSFDVNMVHGMSEVTHTCGLSNRNRLGL